MRTKIRILMTSLLVACAAGCYAQWTPQASNTTVTLRGISVVSDKIAWASGAKGTLLRTSDGGETWTASVVPGAESLDFRDIHAVDANMAYLLSAGPGEQSRIFKTTDGGRHWSLQFTNSKPKGFLDCMDFWDAQHGIVVGDPVDGHFDVLLTSDGGAHWNEVPAAALLPALASEGAFAASGTCVAVQGKKNAWFVTGGKDGARLFRTTDGGKEWRVVALPLVSGKDSTGAFSVAFADESRGIVVGGDYRSPGDTNQNAAYTSDGGKTWTLAATPPSGYRSGVAFVPGTRGPTAIAAGTNGNDYSLDLGKTWTRLTADSFNAVAFHAPDAGWAVGDKGSIARVAGAAPGGSAPSLKK